MRPWILIPFILVCHAGLAAEWFSVSGEIIVAETAESRFEDPRLAAIGEDLILVWKERPIESESVEGRILALPIDVDGEPRASAPIVVVEGAMWGPEVVPFNGVFLVVWASRTSVHAIGIDRLGTVLDSEPRLIDEVPAEISRISVASNGIAAVIVWREGAAGSVSLIGAYVHPDEAIIVAEVTEERPYWIFPAVVSNGRDFLIAWNDCSLERGAFGMYVRCGVLARVVSEEPSLFPIHRIFETGLSANITLASDGDGYLVLAEGKFAKSVTEAGFTTDYSRFGCRITDGGASEPTVGWDGRHYIAAWAINNTWAGDIYGARLNRQGCSLEGSAFASWRPLALSSEGEWSPNILGLGGGKSIYAYEKWALIAVGDTMVGVSYGIAIRTLRISSWRHRPVRR